MCYSVLLRPRYHVAVVDGLRYNKGKDRRCVMASGAEWVTDADLELLQGPLDPPGKYEQAAQSLLRRNAMGAVKTVVDLALNAENERVRLSAAQYVIDRVLGKAEQAGAMNPTEKEGWQNIIESVLVEPSAAARATGSDIVRRPRNL